jgi:hypothetical protein
MPSRCVARAVGRVDIECGSEELKWRLLERDEGTR